ncbi:MAG TPA: extracellular solute-binding protein [Chloroflexota bacterium]|nr:extracellular solute-binding protein [Chloroflexota bacterium]
MSFTYRLRPLAAFMSVVVSLAIVSMACGVRPNPAAAPTTQPLANGADSATTATSAPVAGTDTGSPTTELTVWYFDKVSMQTLIPLFEQSHPGVKVNFVEQPFGDMSKKYLAALAAGQGVPDVIGLDTSMVGQFLDAGENLLAEPYNAGQVRNDFIDWKFNAPITASGEMAAMPWDVATGVMFYRPDAFEAAGLPTEPDQVAKSLATWDDFIKAGQAIKAKSGGQTAIVGNEHDIFNAGFWQKGGNIVRDGSIVVVPQGQQALQTAMKAKEANIGANVPAWSERWAPSLQSGKIATVVMGGWMLGNLQNLIDPDGAGNWRVTTPPGGAFNNGGTYIQIPKLAEHKELAWEFTRFVTTDTDALNGVFEKTGIVPAYKPAWNSPIYDQPVAYLGGEPAFRLMINLAQQVQPLVYSPVDALGTDLLNAQVDSALGGKVPPQQALQNAATQLQERAQRASDLNLSIAAGQ